MARAIDGELLELEIANIANKLAKSDAQKALMGRVMYCVEHMPTLTPQNEPLTQADLDSMDYDKVWIDYGDDGEWALVVNGRIYCLAVLEGAGFEDILREELGGETLDRPSGDYTCLLYTSDAADE
mgnify:FL=1